MTHKGTVTLETDRLILRRFVPNDADAMFRNWCNDAEVTRYLSWQPHGSVDVTRKENLSEIAKYDDLAYYEWAIAIKPQTEPVGGINVTKTDEPSRCFTIGYRLGKAWWNKGYATEALAAVIKFLFEQVGAKRIKARCDARNGASGAVMRKCGMRYEGAQSRVVKGELTDYETYAILAEDYFGD